MDRMPDLVTELRRTLEHIYDPVYLQRCALVQMLQQTPSQTASPAAAKAIRKLLVDAIDELDPGDKVEPNAPSRRGYIVLRQRYLNQESSEKVADALSLSERQVRREVRAALEALAVIVRERLAPQDEQIPSGEGASNLVREIESLHPAWGPTDLQVELCALHDLVRPLAEQHDVTLCPTRTSENAVVLSERVLLRQALLALYTQAVQTTPGATVHTKVLAHDERQVEVRIEVVAPNGGSAPEFADPIEPTMLEALHAQSDTKRSKSGISVTLRLPAAPLKRVLLIDDNRSIHKLMRRYLVGHPFALLSAFDADQGLGLIQTHRPDIILLDVMMSDRDGWEILRQLRDPEHGISIPIVVCSVLDQAALARSLGANAYLPKPVSQDSLLATLEKHTAAA